MRWGGQEAVVSASRSGGCGVVGRGEGGGGGEDVVVVECPERLPLFTVQQYMRSLLLHVLHRLLRGPPVHRHQVAANQGSRPAVQYSYRAVQ